MGWRIEAPFLSDEERKQAAAPGGLSGQKVDTSKLLGPITPDTKRRFTADPLLAALNAKRGFIYGGVDPYVIAARRAKNKQARKARRANRKAGKR